MDITLQDAKRISEFNRELKELRGAFGRKGKVGGSSKTPTVNGIEGKDFVTYFRGEFSQLKEKVLSKGLFGKKWDDRPKSVYLTKSKQDAHLYGVQKTKLGESYAIIEVRIPVDRNGNIFPDETDTKPSFGRMDAVRYQGNISPDWIVSVREFSMDKKYEGMYETEIAKILSETSMAQGLSHFITVILGKVGNE